MNNQMKILDQPGITTYQAFNVWVKWLFSLFLVVASLSVQAAEVGKDWIALGAGKSDLQVALNKSKVLQLSSSIERVSVGNPEIADIVIIGTRQVYVVGKALGSTNVVLWDTSGRVFTNINIEVGHDLQVLKEKLHLLMPDEEINLHSAQGGILLTGQVSSLTKMQAALDVAKTYGEVINLLEIGGAKQVMLEVKVAEVSRSLMKNVDARFNAFNPGSDWKLGAVNGGLTLPDALFAPDDLRFPVFADELLNGAVGTVGPVITEFAPVPLSIGRGLFGSFLNDNALFNVALEIAQDKGLAKILAEPTLTTLTGQEATFISGGEFPIPVPRGDDGITIKFKEYGVGLVFLPVVLDSGKVNLKVNITVSELVAGNNVIVGNADTSTGLFVPALSKRSASSTVELAGGQTLGIAGLISESLRENVSKFPWLGDIPVLGALFRSQSFIKGQTELVIFVTPHFAQATREEFLKLPTDDFVEPSNLEFYLLGKIEGRKSKTKPLSSADISEGVVEGTFGHSP